jgi:protease-4
LLTWLAFSGFGDGFDLPLPGQDKIGLVEITGPIYNSGPIIDQLDAFTDRSGLRALVLRIDSPGGTVVAAQEVHRELERIRSETDLVIVTSMGNVAASGGYYIACASDLIFANPGTITGSIGVIASWTQYDELLEWARLKDVVIKSGELKDAGNPAREMTRTEREFHQSLVDELHDQFVQEVSASRGLSEEEVALLSDGRVFTGSTALDLKLIDGLGNLSDTLDEAAELAGIDENYQLLFRRRDRQIDILDLLESRLVNRLVEHVAGGGSEAPAGYHFLWRPGAAADMQ